MPEAQKTVFLSNFKYLIGNIRVVRVRQFPEYRSFDKSTPLNIDFTPEYMRTTAGEHDFGIPINISKPEFEYVLAFY